MTERAAVHEFAEMVMNLHGCRLLHCKLEPADTECV